MDRLTATSPCAGRVPFTIGALTVSEMAVGPITSVTPFADAPRKDFEACLGMAFPAPLQTTSDGTARCVWVGQGEALLMGAAPDPALGQFAAVVDHSDAWAIVCLQGTGGADALARLVPVDMRLQAFGTGATVCTQVGHVNASITRLDPQSYMIAVFRSMAGTLVHDLTMALEAVAARG